MSKLVGPNAVVTGGASGIGEGICHALAAAGAQVTVTDIDAARGAAVAAALPEGRGRFEQMDVTDRSSVEAIARRVEGQGPLHILVNCAGGSTPKPFFETDEAQWRQLIELNLFGVLRSCHVFAPPMVERRLGRIINISSGAGLRGQAGQAAYSASKGGVNALTRTLAQEFAASGVTVNAVCPGVTETPPLREYRETAVGAEFIARMEGRIPLGRLARPEDIAAAVVFFASDAAGYITSEIISVNGGSSSV